MPAQPRLESETPDYSSLCILYTTFSCFTFTKKIRFQNLGTFLNHFPSQIVSNFWIPWISIVANGLICFVKPVESYFLYTPSTLLSGSHLTSNFRFTMNPALWKFCNHSSVLCWQSSHSKFIGSSLHLYMSCVRRDWKTKEAGEIHIGATKC